ncbi:MAG: helix-turn-helix domain containing protein [Paludibacteraceae bacterium]|nr:helix-turn-helix domain containing protein [Paludibacteraceae bacterium]
MPIQKRKKHNSAVLLKYMHMLDDGYSFSYISTTFGINSTRLKVLRAKYLLEGVTALQRKKNIKADFALKKKIVLDIENNHLTLHAASLKYDASTTRIEDWLKIYRQEGLEALVRAKKLGEETSQHATS